MQPQQSHARLRDILAGDRCVVATSLFDPMSARIADDLGFEVGVIGGSVAALSVLGAPDLILLSLTELAEQSRRVCRAGRVSVIVDADHGYGNALSVMRTVEELQAAGVAGISIEDTLLPRAFGAGDATQLTSLAEGVGKMRAALAARGAGPMLVFGRTSAPVVTGIDDAIVRFQAYEASGVDALFLPGLTSREQLDRVSAATKLPLILAGCKEALHDVPYLQSRRVKVWMAGHQPFAAAVQGMYAAMQAVRDGARAGELANLAPAALMGRLTNAAAYEAATQDYLEP